MSISQRWYRVGAGLTVVAALLPAAGCGKAGGATNPGSAAPSASAAATQAAAPVPAAGQCYAQAIRGYIDSLPPLVDCAADHSSEIAYVGALEPTAAAAAPSGPATASSGPATAPSDPADPSLATADATCRTKTAEYLGTPLGRRGLTFDIGLPPEPSWSAGARWFACEVIVVDGKPGYAAVEPTAGSHAAGKAVPAPRCFVLVRPKTTEGMTETPCDQPHNAEYLGAVRAAFGALPKDDASTVPFVTACHDELAAQMGVAPATVDNKWGYDEYPAPSDLSSEGVTVMQCYFVLWNQKKITRSVLGSKGIGIPSSW